MKYKTLEEYEASQAAQRQALIDCRNAMLDAARPMVMPILRTLNRLCDWWATQTGKRRRRSG